MTQSTPLAPHKSRIIGLLYVLFILIILGLGVAVWWFASQNKDGGINQNANAAAVNVSSSSAVAVESFVALASKAACTQTKNELYLIDSKMVVWVREGSCPDNSYGYVLYARNPQEKLCEKVDSITGPRESCVDDSYTELFTTLTNNLDKEQLGIEASHRVEKISF